MKDLNLLYSECKDEMIAAGIKFKQDTPIEWYNAKSNWGLCEYYPNGKAKKLRISSRLAADYVTDKAVKTVILHEMIHTNDKCHNHGEFFKRYAKRLNDTFGYNIKRTGSYKEYGVKPDVKKVQYKLVCTGCGRESYYSARRNVVKRFASLNGKNIECRLCKCKTFKLIKLGE